MSSEDSHAFADIALLFELSLGVSQSLDLETNCERFLGRLMSRKNLAHAALWIRRDALPPELLPDQPVPDDGLALVYHVPRRQDLPGVLPGNHPAVRRAWYDGPYSTRGLGGVTSAVAPEADQAAGMIAVLPLQGLGLLELGSLARDEPMPARELAQLATVVGGFAVSVKGCLDHLRMVSEMTARKDLDEQLRHAQKMEAVGQLAGGVAHDFNNLLVGIVGSAELLQRAQVGDAERRELAGIILGAGQRAADLTRQLLSFSRRESPVRERVDLNAVVADVVRLLERTVDPRVAVEVEPCPEGAPVLGDGSELQGALLNLGLNARDAMPAGGRLTFRVRPASLHESADTQLSDPLRPGHYLALDVEDTGTGMTEAVRRRIFEPFFTTKPFGRGTGLGLAAVYGIVRRHGGAIAVESAPGHGSRFSLLLPRASGPEPVATSAGPDDVVVRGRGLILVVDDERAVGEMCARMLETLGFNALLAPDGERALELYRREGARIDLVLLDLMMPGLSGVETLRALRELDREAAVVMVSGFGHAVDLRQVQALGIADLLPKPFTIAALSQTVSRILGPRPADAADAKR